MSSAPMVRGQAATPSAKPPAGPAKVRVIVQENNISATGGGGLGTAAASPKASPAPGNAPVATRSQQSAKDAATDDKYTHTSKKTLTVGVVNLTNAPMDVNVKSNFLGKDEGGKHEVVTEKTLEKTLTLQPGKPEQFTTEEVVFMHMTSHYPPQKAGAGKGKGGPPVKMEPASGHSYFGYKVEVFQGNDLVGTAVSANH